MCTIHKHICTHLVPSVVIYFSLSTVECFSLSPLEVKSSIISKRKTPGKPGVRCVCVCVSVCVCVCVCVCLCVCGITVWVVHFEGGGAGVKFCRIIGLLLLHIELPSFVQKYS